MIIILKNHMLEIYDLLFYIMETILTKLILAIEWIQVRIAGVKVEFKEYLENEGMPHVLSYYRLSEKSINLIYQIIKKKNSDLTSLLIETQELSDKFLEKNANKLSWTDVVIYQDVDAPTCKLIHPALRNQLIGYSEDKGLIEGDKLEVLKKNKFQIREDGETFIGYIGIYNDTDIKYVERFNRARCDVFSSYDHITCDGMLQKVIFRVLDIKYIGITGRILLTPKLINNSKLVEVVKFGKTIKRL